jgi:predicted anti-sigma-YlaC factor YlaD
MRPRLPFLLSCREVTELATDYMEAALPLHRRLAVELHLRLCRMCRAYLEQLRRTAALLRGQALPPPAAEVEGAIVTRALERK